ncbi:MAG: hypothetical protein PHI97_31870, partial [Desulfobulbus sp.]|nr:hypothetical protein [Desulfobulbus sp.]
PHRLIQSLGTKKLFSIEDHRACPTNGSDFGSLRSQNLTLFVRQKAEGIWTILHGKDSVHS